VQNAVPMSKLGVATSNLTLFRQIGGSVGLAIMGTVFGTTFVGQLVPELVANGIPQQGAEQLAAFAGGSGGELTGVGGTSLADTLATVLPAPFQSFIPGIVSGIHDAFTAGVATTFVLGVVTTIIAVLATLLLKELPLRKSFGPGPGEKPAASAAAPGAAAE